MAEEGRRSPDHGRTSVSEESDSGTPRQRPAQEKGAGEGSCPGASSTLPEERVKVQPASHALSCELSALGPGNQPVQRSKPSETHTCGSSRSSLATSHVSFSNSQAAKLEATRKRLTLEELESQMKEEREVEVRYQEMDEQTHLRERKGLTRRLLEIAQSETGVGRGQDRTR